MNSSHVKIKHRLQNLTTLGFDLGYFPKYVNFVPKPHSVDIVLLSFVIKGEGIHYMDADRYPEKGGSIGITHYGQTHSIVTGPEGMEIMNIYIDVQHYPLPQLPNELNSVLPQLIPLHPRFGNRLNRMVQLQFEDPAPVIRTVHDIYAEITNKPIGYADTARTLFKLFLIHCCRHALAHGIHPSSSSYPGERHYLEPIRNYLDTNYAHHHSLSSLAERASLSKTYLCRAFKKYTGKSVFDYLLDRRIQAAMLKLRTTNNKILHIALSCGFGDVSFFNRTFKARVGISPQKYRVTQSASV